MASSTTYYTLIPYTFTVAVMLVIITYCNAFMESKIYPIRQTSRRHYSQITKQLQSSQPEERQLDVNSTNKPPPPTIIHPPPELKRVPLPAMLAGGLFLFATSVPSSQKPFANKLLQLAEKALQSDPTIVMELGPGIEAGNVYASSFATTTSNSNNCNVNQLVLQFQINGGNCWSQGVTYGIQTVEDGDVTLMALEVANMDATLNNVSFQVPLIGLHT